MFRNARGVGGGAYDPASRSVTRGLRGVDISVM